MVHLFVKFELNVDCSSSPSLPVRKNVIMLHPRVSSVSTASFFRSDARRSISDDNWAEMTFDRGRGVWVAEIELSSGAERHAQAASHRSGTPGQESGKEDAVFGTA